MVGRTFFLKIWGVAIMALGTWYIAGSLGAEAVDRSNYRLTVGVFCGLIGLGVLAFSFGVLGKRDE